MKAFDIISLQISNGVIPQTDQIKTLATHIEDEAKVEEILNLSFLQDYNDFEELSILSNQKMRLKRRNQFEQVKSPLSEKELQLAFEVLCLRNQVEWNYQNPYTSFYCQINNKQFRATLLHSSIDNISRYYLRAIPEKTFKLESFTLNSKMIIKSIHERKNILIVGATGSGKTSFISSLLNNISNEEHIVIVEDTKEIIAKNLFVTRMLARNNNQHSLKNYMQYCLRISPDRIILGEIRSIEIIPYLLALNTGHKGCLATIHANSAKDALLRLATLYCIYSEGNIRFEQVMAMVCQNIDEVVFLQNKKVIEHIKVYGSQEGSPIFENVIDEKELISF